jgi:bile acid:Na+ symporter, BASS family
MNFALLVQVLFSAIVFVIMFGMGLSLTAQDFRAMARAPRPFLLGLTVQMLLVPVAVLAVALVLPVGHDVKTGMVLLAACPGGVTSNAITLAAKADAALAVGLTAASSLLVALSFPVWTEIASTLFLGAGRSVALPFAETALSLALLTALPVLLGMAVRCARPGMALALLPPFRFVAIGLIVVMCGITTASNARFLADLRVLAESAAACVALLTVAMGLGYALSRLARLPKAQALTVMIEAGVHNVAIGLLVSIALLGDPAIARLPLVYGLAMLVLPWIFIAAVARR